jgi:alpha-tubulin suppressor-like RCC1 family protein
VQNGGAYTWGENIYGQLGDGTTTNRSTPVPVSGLASGVTAVAANTWGPDDVLHSLAVQNGAAYAWGQNGSGQLGVGTRTYQGLTPVAVSGMDSGVTSVAAGVIFSLAVKNGGLWAWGSNSSGQLGIGVVPTSPSDPFWRILTPAAVIGLESGVTAISAGQVHNLAVKDGAVYAWGNNLSGQLGDGTNVTRGTPQLVPGLESGATAVAVSNLRSLAVVNGGVYEWGNGGHTPVQIDPTNLSNIVAVAASQQSRRYALSSDGSLWYWNNFSGLPTPQHLLPPVGFKFTSIAIGPKHAVATLAGVPEPSTLLLLCFGSLAVLWRRRLAARDLRP